MNLLNNIIDITSHHRAGNMASLLMMVKRLLVSLRSEDLWRDIWITDGLWKLQDAALMGRKTPVQCCMPQLGELGER